MGTNILSMTVISFLIGLSISGQTFYMFILENLDTFAALKAIGAKGRELIYMILYMATFPTMWGYARYSGSSHSIFFAVRRADQATPR